MTNTVKNAFWMSDLSDRKFLEQFLPINFEYDQLKINFHVKIIGTVEEHIIHTNGKLTELAKNEWYIEFANYFTSSSIFYHLTGINDHPKTKFIHKSIDGREIPIELYGRNGLGSFKIKILTVLKELEEDYGPWPHPSVVVYAAGRGGMEYCGATVTSLSALGHELTHSYFARGIMPARGNAGWMDEAIASWRDGGYRHYEQDDLKPTKMAGHSVYRRTTDYNAYTKGARFMGHLDKYFEEQGGLKKFLRVLKGKRLFRPMLTVDFRRDLEKYFEDDLQELFDIYIYGKYDPVDEGEKTKHVNPYHPVLTEKQLMSLL